MFKTANRRGTCVPARIIACLGPGTLMAELMGPGTAFRCVPSYLNEPWIYFTTRLFKSISLAVSAALTELCGLLSAVLGSISFYKFS